MNLSFEDFVNKYLGDPFKLYPYQIEFLKNIVTIKRPFNWHEYCIKERQISRRNQAMLSLYYNLLDNKSVLDLYLSLYFHFITNDDGELELVIDEYSQPKARFRSFVMDDLGNGYISQEVFDHVVNIKKQSFDEKLEEALDFIKEITLDVV